MHFWRLTTASRLEKAFSGDESAAADGRWHSLGARVVYCAESLSLAALEKLVHLSPGALDRDYVAIRVTVPDDVTVTRLAPDDLPRDWRSVPPPSSLQELGKRWCQSLTSVLLEVPSALVPFEKNAILNPRHPDFARLKLAEPLPWQLDPRLCVGLI